MSHGSRGAAFATPWRRAAAAALLLGARGRVSPAAAPSAIARPRTTRPPGVDGRLDDPVWGRAARVADFRTLHPEPGLEPSQRTEALLAYDRTTLYVAVRSFDRHPDSLRTAAAAPEDAWHDDWVAFCLDPRADGLDAAYFLVTPSGFRVAGVLGADGGPEETRDFAWRNAVRRTADGWTVEMAVPLAQLPYRAGGPVTMAFKVARGVGRSGEEMDAPAIDPSRPHLAQLRRIELAGVEPSRADPDRALFDVHDAYRDKLRLIARLGDSTLEQRVRAYGDASVLDHLVFPSRPLEASGAPRPLARRPDDRAVAARFDRLEGLPGLPVGDLERFLERTLTTSLIVVRNDTIVYERYFNGWGRDSVFTSFSVAKAFVSTLVGIAVDSGLIGSVGDPITRYLPELAGRDPRFARITVRDLLRMASGLRYVEGAPPRDDQRTYMDPDLRRAGLEGSTIVEAPGTRWLYNNYNPLLLGMILERVSGRPVTALLQRWIWEPLGMEFGGSWSLDSRRDGFEKMESGINARAVDFAKLGQLYLHRGSVGGRRIVSEEWVRDATQPWPEPPGYYEDQGFFGPGGHYFGYFWWGDRRDAGESDFHTVGNKGQFIYVSPQRHLVIVRTGIQFGISSVRWLRLFRGFANGY